MLVVQALHGGIACLISYGLCVSLLLACTIHRIDANQYIPVTAGTLLTFYMTMVVITKWSNTRALTKEILELEVSRQHDFAKEILANTEIPTDKGEVVDDGSLGSRLSEHQQIRLRQLAHVGGSSVKITDLTLFKLFDVNSSNKISFTEFLKLVKMLYDGSENNMVSEADARRRFTAGTANGLNELVSPAAVDLIS